MRLKPTHLLFVSVLTVWSSAAPALGWATLIGCARGLLSRVQPGDLSLRRDPAAAYWRVTSLPADRMNALEIAEFRTAAIKLRNFAQTKQDSTAREHAAILSEGLRRGHLPYIQLLGSMIEVAFAGPADEVNWEAHAVSQNSMQAILSYGGVLWPVVDDTLLTRLNLFETRGAFIYPIQLVLTPKLADGENMPPWRFLHHDLRHTVRKALADAGRVGAMHDFAPYSSPLEQISNQRFFRGEMLVHSSQDRQRELLRRLSRVEVGFRNDLIDVLHQLFHDGIDVPAYVTMPWEPQFAAAVLADAAGRSYVEQNILPHLPFPGTEPERRARASRALDWIRAHLAAVSRL